MTHFCPGCGNTDPERFVTYYDSYQLQDDEQDLIGVPWACRVCDYECHGDRPYMPAFEDLVGPGMDDYKWNTVNIGAVLRAYRDWFIANHVVVEASAFEAARDVLRAAVDEEIALRETALAHEMNLGTTEGWRTKCADSVRRRGRAAEKLLSEFPDFVRHLWPEASEEEDDG